MAEHSSRGLKLDFFYDLHPTQVRRNPDKLFFPSENAVIIGARFMCSRGVPVSNLPNRFQQSAAAGEIDPCTWLAFRGGSVQPESVMLVM